MGTSKPRLTAARAPIGLAGRPPTSPTRHPPTPTPWAPPARSAFSWRWLLLLARSPSPQRAQEPCSRSKAAPKGEAAATPARAQAPRLCPAGRSPPTACAPSRWSLLWSDEFNGATLDRGKWEPQIASGCQYGIPGWGNGER